MKYYIEEISDLNSKVRELIRKKIGQPLNQNDLIALKENIISEYFQGLKDIITIERDDINFDFDFSIPNTLNIKANNFFTGLLFSNIYDGDIPISILHKTLHYYDKRNNVMYYWEDSNIIKGVVQ